MLSILGSGIRLAGQITPESQSLIQNADQVFAVMADTWSLRLLQEMNPSTQSLQVHYQVGKRRDETYGDMVDTILASVRAGKKTCAVFYGHPGVYVFPSHEAIRIAREEGFHAQMFPAISAEDCLFADLGIDPARSGWQSYEAMDFLLYARKFDPTAALVLWQIAAVGDYQRKAFQPDRKWLQYLVNLLLGDYPEAHPVTLYQAAMLPIEDPKTDAIRLVDLPQAELHPAMTLYIPPVRAPQLDAERVVQLCVNKEDLAKNGYQQYR